MLMFTMFCSCKSSRKSKSLSVSLMQRKAEQELHCSSSCIHYISSGPVPSNCCWYHLELQKERRHRYFLSFIP